jgi:hypothetical protein
MKRALLLSFVVECTTESVSTTEQPALAANALAANALTSNALAANALAANALAANALAANGVILNPDVSLALEDPNAQIFMKYLVECALDPTQVVTWTSRRPVPTVSFQGMLGLCPTWQTAVPDQGCRERVSACLLARNNSFSVSVPLSMRGQRDNSGAPLELSPAVPVHDRYPWTNTVVASSYRCPLFSSQPYGDPNRWCSWRLDKVGVCTPGSAVTIGAGIYAGCNSQQEWLGALSFKDEMLRVCAGTSACDADGALASVNDACPGTGAPMIDFVCPPQGIYAVMQATAAGSSWASGIVGSTRVDEQLCREIVGEQRIECRSGWDETCENLAAEACRYPATEQRVFRWKEGAFFGDIFAGLDPLKPQMRVNKKDLKVQSLDPVLGWVTDNGDRSRAFIGVVFPQMYACSSRNWTDPEAYVAARVCAGPNPLTAQYTKNCAAQYIDRCDLICDTEDEGVKGDWDVARCKISTKAKKMWNQPITTFVAQPCDIVTGAFCTTASATPIMGW